MEERKKIMIKRLSGGLILLCLTSISLGVTSGEVSITDTDVLEQLKELRTFIDVNRDFSKGFKNLKPVLIEYRSSASKFNGIALGNLSFNTDALHMSIGINTIQADGKMLIVTINVVYEWEDYIGYKVKSAKLTAYETLATGDGTFTGDVGVGGDLEVTGDASFGDITQIGNVTDLGFKALYYHPIIIESASYRITCAIINNRATAYTLADFKLQLETYALVNASGGFIVNDGTTSTLLSASLIYTRDVEGVMKSQLQGIGIKDGSLYAPALEINLDSEEVTFFNDGVNKIN